MKGRRGRGIRRGVAAVGVVASSLAIAACERGDEPPPGSTAEPRPDAHSYVVAIADLLPPGDDTGEAAPVVFLVPLDEPLALDAQATVIDSFTPAHDVRFVDELAAAVDADQPGAPPRDAGVMVIGLGRISEEPPHLVRIERYRTADDVVADLVTLTFGAGRWVVATTESVPPEVLVHAT